MKNWLAWVWRLGSPTSCHLQAGDPEKPVVELSPSEDLRARELKDSVNPSLRAKEDDMFQVKQWGRGKKTEIPPFWSFSLWKALNVLADAHPHWGGPPASLSWPICMLLSSGNVLADISRNNVYLDIHGLVWFTTKINNYTHPVSKGSVNKFHLTPKTSLWRWVGVLILLLKRNKQKLKTLLVSRK
jgi:hypothetical protein